MQVVSVVVVSPCDKCASHIEENWTKSVKNIKRIINTWEKGNLSIAGKVCIIKTCLIHSLCIMQALVVPYPVLTQVNGLLFRIFGARKTVIARPLRK